MVTNAKGMADDDFAQRYPVSDGDTDVVAESKPCAIGDVGPDVKTPE
jgi:hypothetical protein